ncbi:CocE/NonD family hydrolase [Nocardia brasiliensis]|uniref:CocE/NonD family hydrolase n=1 Tax=Nocardia brasiliensis TaxID=37326 RepID=A0A6G9Y000_NOCBR|nr:CocE/NonD family hydrolase [Nocardia brasiliensis]QIS06535.1 CocE/NonD family hydrolase [Nocardia brasiliensis]
MSIRRSTATLLRLVTVAGVLIASALLPTVAPRATAEPSPTVGLPKANARTGLPDGWQPAPERYGVGEQKNVELPMADGVVLRADVRYPTDASGAPAAGPFPIVLTQSAYGKDSAGLVRLLSYEGLGPLLEQALPSVVDVAKQIGDAAGYGDYFVERGYISVIVDIRGTGSSNGQWSILQPQEREDAKRVIRWAAALPNSTGEVGLWGLSYLGMSELFAAGVLEQDSPVKAMFPLMVGNHAFQDLLGHDGFYNTAFLASMLQVPITLLPQLDPILGLYREPGKLASVFVDHLLSHFRPEGTWPSLFNALADGDRAYNGPYWESRAIDTVLDRVGAAGIPTYLIGGQYDLLQDGTPRTFAGLQNAYAGRSHHGPMPAHAPSSGRFQMLTGPWFHIQPGVQRNTDIDMHALQLAWFDRWLKDDRNGIDETETPLHAIDINGNVIESATYPVRETPTRNLYLAADGRLTPDRPVVESGSDRVRFSPVNGGTICNASFSRNFSGVYELLTTLAGVDDPCARFPAHPDIPGLLDNPQYTTDPFTEPTVLAGPIGATLFAVSNTPASAFSVTVQDIAPDGTAFALTDGQLAGNFRALDEERTWRAADGSVLGAFHPGTRESMLPVVPGELTEYNVKVRPAFHVFEPGHRLQVTIASGDAPTHIFNPKDYPALLGGEYDIQRTGQAASFLTLPLAGLSRPRP